LCLSLGSVEATTRSITLAWDPSPDPSVVGYYLYYGTASHVYGEKVDAGSATSATVEGLFVAETYFFAVTAYNQQQMESEPSGEVVYTVPAPDPEPISPPVTGQLRIARGPAPGSPNPLELLVPPTYQYQIQASQDLKSWETIHSSVSLSTNWTTWVDPQATRFPERFYRLALPDAPQVSGMISIVRDSASGIVRESASGGARLRVATLAGQSYRIEASQDMVTWTTIYSGVGLSTDPVELTDPAAQHFQKRCYRLAFD